METGDRGPLQMFGDVVVVEDDPTLRELLAEIVGDFGAVCRAFATCDEALTYLTNDSPCGVVISDHGVPGCLQGFDFLMIVQARWPLVRCVLTSGYDMSEYAIPKHWTYLAKPWTVTSLQACFEGI